MKELNKYQIAGIGILLIALIYAYSKGVFKKEKGFKTSEGNVTDNSTTTKDDNSYKNIAKSFRDSLIGNSTSGAIFWAACDSLLNLNDADLISVSNAYNSLYVNKDYNTLRALLVQEWAVSDTSRKKKNDLLARFNKIGI